MAAAQSANIEMMGYTNVLDVSAKLEGVLPRSISGNSPMALFDVVYPGDDHEQIMMDLFAGKSHLSHGYKLTVNNVTIGNTYLPWNKMFSGVARVTIEKMEEEEPPYVPEKNVARNPDVPMSPVYLSPYPRVGNFENYGRIPEFQSLHFGSGGIGGGGGSGGGIVLFALGFVAALGIVSILSGLLRRE